MALDRPRVLLQLEGLAILMAAVVLYVELDYNWLPFVLLALAPDVAFFGYPTAFKDTHLQRV